MTAPRMTPIIDPEALATTTQPDENLPVGTPVLAFPGSRDGRAMLTRTRSEVWTILGNPVVLVEGYAGGIALTHVEALPAQTPAQYVAGLADWVASNRAHNGSTHKHGQSLYNEGLNAVLHDWCKDYIAALAEREAGRG